MALHELLAALREDAAAQRAHVLSDAEAEASRVRRAASAAAARRRAEFMSRITNEAEGAARRTLSRTRAEAMQSVLTARARFLERLRAALESRLCTAVQDPEYLASIASELRAGMERLPNGRVVVRASPGLARAMSEMIPTIASGATVESAPDVGTGFVLASGDGRLEVDATLDTRLSHVWPRLAAAALAEVRR